MQELHSSVDNSPQTTKKPWHKTWWGYALQFFLWPFTITYYVWKNDKWSKKSKIIGLSIFWIVVLAAGQAADNAPKTSVPSAPTQANSAPVESTPPAPQVSDEEQKLKHQDAVKKFEEEMYATEKSASAAFEEFKNAAADFSSNDKTTFDLYELAKTAKAECKKAQLVYGTMRTPDDLPKDVKQHLKEAATNLSTSYYTKGQALDQALLYLEENKLSALSEYKENMNMADGFMFKGVAELMKAKELVGLPMVEQSDSTTPN